MQWSFWLGPSNLSLVQRNFRGDVQIEIIVGRPFACARCAQLSCQVLVSTHMVGFEDSADVNGIPNTVLPDRAPLSADLHA